MAYLYLGNDVRLLVKHSKHWRINSFQSIADIPRYQLKEIQRIFNSGSNAVKINV